MTSDERLDRIEQDLQILVKIHMDNDREYHERFEQMDSRWEQMDSRWEQMFAHWQQMREEERARARVLDERWAQTMDSINRLYRVAVVHGGTP